MTAPAWHAKPDANGWNVDEWRERVAARDESKCERREQERRIDLVLDEWLDEAERSDPPPLPVVLGGILVFATVFATIVGSVFGP